MRAIILAILAVTAASSVAAQTRIFTETFDDANPGNFGTGNTIGRFKIDAGDIDVIGDRNGSFYGCPNGIGNNCVDLNGNTPGTITAMMNLIAGDTYRVSFDIAGNGPRSSNLYDMAAGLGNSPYYRFTTTPGAAFKSVSFDYLATRTGTATLQLQSLNTDYPLYWGMIVDNITVDNLSVQAAVPEPSVWAMMILGFGLIGLSVRRSRRAVARLLDHMA